VEKRTTQSYGEPTTLLGEGRKSNALENCCGGKKECRGSKKGKIEKALQSTEHLKKEGWTSTCKEKKEKKKLSAKNLVGATKVGRSSKELR